VGASLLRYSLGWETGRRTLAIGFAKDIGSSTAGTARKVRRKPGISVVMRLLCDVDVSSSNGCQTRMAGKILTKSLRRGRDEVGRIRRVILAYAASLTLSFGINPSCCIRPNASQLFQPSTNFPSTTWAMLMPVTVMWRPVGGMLPRLPV
jgi:hypothetical protein